ncbi:MAG TPA: hypothetical protein HA348_06100 [Thermoplasmata archaeon]|nr:hypothetical protein [Thermoplasmata archaeon]
MKSTSEDEEEYRALQLIGKSWRILKSNPVLFIPQIILIGIEYTGGLIFSSSLVPLIARQASEEVLTSWLLGGEIGWVIVSVVVTAWIWGVYPILVKDVLEGEPPKITEAFKEAWHRILSLLGAILLIGLICVGCLFIPIVGIVLLFFCIVWFYHYAPAVMLDNNRAVESLDTSKDFSLGKKWSILGIIAFTQFLPVLIILVLLLPPLILAPESFASDIILYLGGIVGFAVGILFTTLGAIIPAYGYLKHKHTPVTSSHG